MTESSHPANEPRVRSVPFTVERVEENGDGLTLSGYAAVFNSPTRIDSWEGRFDEIIAPGAFKRTLNARTPVLQFDHGQHPMVGSIPLGRFTAISEDERGLYVEARLSDNWLVQPVRDAIRDGAISGMSFRFEIVKQTEQQRDDDVPLHILREVKLFEAGPVVWPAYEDTTVGVRQKAVDAMVAAGLTPESVAAAVDRTSSIGQQGLAQGTPPENEPANPTGDPQGSPPALSTTTALRGAAMETSGLNQEQLREAVEYLDAVIRDLDARAGDHALPADEQQAYEDGKALRAQYATELAAIVARKDYLRALAKAPSHHESTTPDPLGEPGSIKVPKRGNPWDLDAVSRTLSVFDRAAGVTELKSRALSAIEHVGGMDDRQKQHLTTILESLDLDDPETMIGTKRAAAHIVAVSSPDYLRAWTRCLKAAIRGQQHEDMRILQRAMSLTDAAGGFAVPLPVDPTLIPNYDVSVHPFRQLATVRTIVTDQLRTVNSTGVAFSWDGEAAEVSDDATTFANIDITVHKAQGFIPFSIEIGGDYPGFTEDVRMLLQDGKDDLEATAFVSGTGTNQPIGIVTALTGTASVIPSATADTFAVADVYNTETGTDAVAGLAAKWRARAQWVAHKKTYTRIRQFGTSDSHALWTRLGEGQPERLLGYQTNEAEDMDSSITALADNYLLVLGDWRNYFIVDRVGFSMELVPHLFATGANRPSGQRGFYAWWRVGADSVNDRAFRILNVT